MKLRIAAIILLLISTYSFQETSGSGSGRDSGSATRVTAQDLLVSPVAENVRASERRLELLPGQFVRGGIAGRREEVGRVPLDALALAG